MKHKPMLLASHLVQVSHTQAQPRLYQQTMVHLQHCQDPVQQIQIAFRLQEALPVVQILMVHLQQLL